MKKSCSKNFNVYLVLCIVLLAMLLIPGQTVSASALSDPVAILSVDYEEENIIIDNANGNTKFYFATETDAAKGRWEVIPADIIDDGTGTIAATTIIDFSWLSPSIENIIRIKGDVDKEQTRIIIVERTRKLEVSINYSNIENIGKNENVAELLNIMSSAGTGLDPITYDDLEWKKGDAGKWQANVLTVGQLEKYQIMGTYLYFRIKAVPDDTVSVLRPYIDGTQGRRASNEVKVKIAKKTASMVIGVDGGRFNADIKYGKEYRITTDAGTTGWIKITDKAIKTIPLKKIANLKFDYGSNGTTTAFGTMFLEIRDYSTSKAASSKITEISLDAQRTISGAAIEADVPLDVTSEDKNVYISYNGIKNMIITVPAASLEVPYEYSIVKSGEAFDVERAVWTAVTKNIGIKILASKALEGGKLYIRQKEIKSKLETKTTLAVGYKLASTYLEYVIKYPSIPVVDKESFTFTKGYSEAITFEAKLNIAGKKPFETKIKNIKLGTKDILFDDTDVKLVAGDPDPLINTAEYVMTIVLKEESLKMMANCSNRAIVINFENGTIDKTSIKLTIQNPTLAAQLTASATPSTVSGSAISVVTPLGTGNTWVYTISDEPIANPYTMNKVDALTKETAFTTSKIELLIAAGKYITIYEINSSDNIIKYKSIQIK